MSESSGAAYYAAILAGDRLRRCYEVAPPRVKQYLEAELRFLLSNVGPGDDVLELGCGHGRVAVELARRARHVIGIDTAPASLDLARSMAAARENCEFREMNAGELTFQDGEFDVVACIQNGICAFRLDPVALVGEALRVTRAGGLALFSSYAAVFWPHRLEWFEAQAAAGLVGEIDQELTVEGTVVCKDGLRLGAMGPAEFREIGRRLGLEPRVVEVDQSSVFAVWRK